MRHPFLTGDKLYLRSLESADLDGEYFDWLNDGEVTKFLASGVFPMSKEKMEEYYRNVVLSSDNVMLAIVDKKSDKHIGNIRLGPINWISRIAELGVMIGDKEFWHKGYSTEAIKLLVEYAFHRLNLHKVTAGVIAENQASVRAFEKAGFAIEGRGKSQFFLDGEYCESLYMGIIRESHD